MGWLPAVVSSVANVAGSIVGAKSRAKADKKAIKYQKELNQNRIRWTVEDAKRAGIHPLAALGASSVGGFAIPQPSSTVGDAIGAAISDMGSTFASQYEADADRIDRERARIEDRAAARRAAAAAAPLQSLQADLTQAQIDEVRSRTKLMEARAAAIGGATSTSSDLVTSNTAGQTLVRPTGIEWKSGSSTDAQNWEDRYGGLVGEVLGIGNYLYDWWNQ